MIRIVLNKENVTEKKVFCVHQRTLSRKQIGNLNKMSKIVKATETERRLVVICPKGGRMGSHCLMFTQYV